MILTQPPLEVAILQAIEAVTLMSEAAAQQEVVMQQHRRDFLLKCKAAGDKFLEIEKLFAEACKDDPAVTPWGEFSSFTKFVKSAKSLDPRLPSASTISNYMKLARHWDVVEKLELLDLKHCYRLLATIGIIEWYLEESKTRPEEELTVAAYWNWLHGNKDKVLTKKQLSQRVEDLEMQLGIARTTISQLEKELSRYKQEAKPLPAALFVR